LVDSRREFEEKMPKKAIARQLELIENEDVRLKDMLTLSQQTGFDPQPQPDGHEGPQHSEVADPVLAKIIREQYETQAPNLHSDYEASIRREAERKRQMRTREVERLQSELEKKKT